MKYCKLVVVAVTQRVHNHKTVEDHCCGHHVGRCDSHHAEQESNRDHAYSVKVRVRVKVRIRGQVSKDKIKKKFHTTAMTTTQSRLSRSTQCLYQDTQMCVCVYRHTDNYHRRHLLLHDVY